MTEIITLLEIITLYEQKERDLGVEGACNKWDEKALLCLSPLQKSPKSKIRLDSWGFFTCDRS